MGLTSCVEIGQLLISIEMHCKTLLIGRTMGPMASALFRRQLRPPQESFFLFGPRGCGKTTWLKEHFSSALKLDLLEPRTFLQLSRDPSYLAGLVGGLKPKEWVVIDEIQKLPILLDSVHQLIETKNIRFALTGSSARKLKRSGANLLAGRAILREMFPLISAELEDAFDLNHCLRWGGLPKAVVQKEPRDYLEAYFHMYLKEEIREEGVVRQIDPFIRFLEIAANLNGQVLNVESIARDTGSKRPTVDKWFLVLQDTLLAHMLAPWRPGFKVRESAHPKFYLFDPGVARAAAGRMSSEDIDSVWLGIALETWMLHEVRAYNSYSGKRRELYYYALPSDLDIDLIIETKKATHSHPSEVVGIEFKSSKRWRREWEAPLRDLKSLKKCNVKRMIGVYQGDDVLHYEGFDIYPVRNFLNQLHQGMVF